MPYINTSAHRVFLKLENVLLCLEYGIGYPFYIIGIGIPCRTIELFNIEEFVVTVTSTFSRTWHYFMEIMIPKKPNQPGQLARFVKQTHAKSVFSRLIDSINVDSWIKILVF